MSESQNIEWKQSWHDDYLKWICGFANAIGGTIYIGKNDTGEVVHLDNYQRLLEDIPTKIRNQMGIVCDVQLLEKTENKYIQIKVNPYTVPVSLRGRYYYRTGSTKIELTGVQLNEFLLKKAGKTWDDIIEESAHFSDIETKSVEAFKKEAFTSGRLPQDILELPIKETLEKLRLATGDKLKRAALILFGKDPNKFYPNIKVKIGRFGTNDADLRFQEILEGNILELLKQVPEMLNSKFLTRPIVFEGLQRIEKDTYPVAAIREMLLNALVHRTYMGSMIQIRVYDDKLTIWNEGNLPEGMTIASLKGHHVSRPRNPLIADVCFKAGFIDSWGRGTIKIFEACENAGLPDATIASLDGGILVTLNQQSSDQVSDQDNDQDAIMKSFEAIQKEFGLLSYRISLGKEKNSAFLRGNYGVFTGYLRGKFGRNSEEIRNKFGINALNTLMLVTIEPSISANDIGEIMGVTSRTIENYLSKLKDDKVIEREGSTKSGLWKIIGQQ
jgi:ATP-dependent DNA helicase RecG